MSNTHHCKGREVYDALTPEESRELRELRHAVEPLGVEVSPHEPKRHEFAIALRHAPEYIEYIRTPAEILDWAEEVTLGRLTVLREFRGRMT